jgi:hypothetical protein
MDGQSNRVELGGGLVDLQDAALMLSSLIYAASGGTDTFQVTGSTQPLVKLKDSSLSVYGGLIAGRGVSLYDSTATDPDQIGTGKDEILKVSAPVIEATGDSVITTNGAGPALGLDTALFNATAPVVSLLGATLSHTTGTMGGTSQPIVALRKSNLNATMPDGKGIIDVYQGNAISSAPAFGLDRSLLTVVNGSLLNATGGATVSLTDLLSVANQSKVTVVNGTLISADGAGTRVNISNSLVNFGGTGNQVIIRNDLTRTMTQVGVPIHTDNPSNVNVYSGIVNPSGNIFTVTGTAATSYNTGLGVAIKATNGARVSVGAPN